MNAPGLRPSSEIREADWLAPRLHLFGTMVAAVVPDGFSAYVRILHPARGRHDQPVTWAEVAAWSGRTMHRLVQFQAIARLLTPTTLDPAPWDGQDSPTGNLPPDLLRALSGTLGEHTGTAGSCWFCLWDGYGWPGTVDSVAVLTSGHGEPRPVAAPDLRMDPHGARVRLPARDYALFRASLEAAPELGWTASGGVFQPQSPNLFWPQDRAWCVASEIDLYCTLVAGSQALADALLADPRLETWSVEPTDPIAYDSDTINT